MVEPTDAEALRAAWRALAGQGDTEGWRTIALGSRHARFRAGVRYPDEREAILIGFNLASDRPSGDLPRGRGFSVLKVPGSVGTGFSLWFGLCREPSGSLDLFTLMVVDILGAVETSRGSEAAAFQIFLTRIRIWQSFMQRARDGLLSSEEEVGLFGELLILQELADLMEDPRRAVELWQGPLNGVQDFITEGFSLEIKTSIAKTGFPAKISSLEQLDNCLGQPLFLGAVRLCLQVDGHTLPEKIGELREIFGSDTPARSMFETRLLLAGYADNAAEAYTRQYAHLDTRILAVDEAFPCLARSAVRPEIRDAVYELDLDLIAGEAMPLHAIICQSGVFTTR